MSVIIGNYVGSKVLLSPSVGFKPANPRPTLGNWQGSRHTHLMLTTALTYCSTDNFLSSILVCDWFIYKLLWKLDTSSKKEMKMIKTQHLLMKKKQKNFKKVHEKT